VTVAVPEFLPQRFDPLVPLDQLHPHPANPNEGDLGLLCELLDANGFAGAVMAQESTGILIDGETRYHAAAARNLPGLPVIWVDVDDDTRDRLLAEWNESGRRGINNETKLLALLQGLAVTPKGLEGAAFDGDDLDTLVARLSGPLVIDPAGSGAGYGEDDAAMAERRDRIEGYADRKDGGALIEMILVFTTADRAEAGRLIGAVREHDADPELRAADVVLRALRGYAAILADPAHEDLAAAALRTPAPDADPEGAAAGAP
jgi:hypothetical protein